MKIIIFITSAFPILVLSACGVTLEAKHLSAQDDKHLTPSVIAGEGIVYALPKTQVEIIQPVKMTIATSGVINGTIDNCRRACEAGGIDTTEACTVSAGPKLKFFPPEVRTTQTPDHGRLYQVSPTADIFQTLDFKYEIASNGVIDKADASSTNMAFELATSIASTAVKTIGVASTFMTANLKNFKTNKQRNCYEVSTDVASLEKNKDAILSCSLLKEVETCMSPFENAISTERSALNALFINASVNKTDPKLLALIAANRRERIEAAVAKRNEVAAIYGLEDGKPKEATYQILIPMDGPPDFTTYENTISLGTAVTSGTARILGSSDNAADYLSTLAKSLIENTRTYVVKTSMPKHIKFEEEDNVLKSGGFRYRIPTMAPTSLTVYSAEDIKNIVFGPLIDKKIIAQYGPIAALPSKFKGKGGRVMVKIWPDSGGLQTVEIGADALPTSSFTGVVDDAFNQYKSLKDKADSRAAAAAATDSELDSLTRQQKLLALKKQIKDLEDSLKN